jgi:beta-lactamase class A
MISGSTTLDSEQCRGFSSCVAVKPEDCMGVIRAARSVSAWQLAAIFAVAVEFISPAVASPLRAQSAPIAYGSAVCSIPDSVHGKLERIARRVRGNVGIGAIHLESGTRLSLNGDRAFPMASVSKIPIALEFLRRVDAGEISFHETIVVPPTDFRPGNSPLAKWSRGRSVRLSIDSLFSLMLGVSDNTATDVILRMAGGPDEATRRLRELGVEGVRVDRSEARTFADLVGISEDVPESELYRVNHFRMRDALPVEHRGAARERYGHDPRDTATPEGMAELLALIYDGAGLSASSHELLLDVMTRSRSGRRRLRGLLPSSTKVAHKTGTMAAAINDVGIITLPNGAGHLALAVFVNTLHATTWRRERTIAEVARVLHDYFSAAYRVPEFGTLVAESSLYEMTLFAC